MGMSGGDGQAGWAGLLAGHAVDALADQIGVAVVTRVLLDHVQTARPANNPGWLLSASDRGYP